MIDSEEFAENKESMDDAVRDKLIRRINAAHPNEIFHFQPRVELTLRPRRPIRMMEQLMKKVPRSVRSM